MSIKAIKLAYLVTAGSPSSKAVLQSLAYHANDQMQCWQSISTIGRETELHPDTVSRSLASLTARGIITRTPRYAKGTKARMSDVITLHLTSPHSAGTTSPQDAVTSPQDAATPPSMMQGGSPHQGGDIEPSLNLLSEPTEREADAPRSRRQHSTRLPADWKASDLDRQHARNRGLDDAQIGFQEAEFREFWLTDGGVKKNWSLTFRNRIDDQIVWKHGVNNLPRKSASARASSRFDVDPNTPQWQAWHDYYASENKTFYVREMDSCAQKGTTFPVPAEWPPVKQQVAA